MNTNLQGTSIPPQSCLHDKIFVSTFKAWLLSTRAYRFNRHQTSWSIIRCDAVMVCTCLSTNRASLELQSLLSHFFFFQKLSFQIVGAAYLQVWLIHGLLRYKEVFSHANTNSVLFKALLSVRKLLLGCVTYCTGNTMQCWKY